MRTVVLRASVWLFASMSSPLVAQVPSFDPDDGNASFEAMAEYLARDGGRWRSDNPNYDPNRVNSPPAFGLWFTRALNGRVLDLRIVVHYADSTVVSSEGQWAWHPGESRLTYRMVGRNGSLTEGTTDFERPSTFTTVTTAYSRRGNASVHRDDNVLVDDSLHRNETFRRNTDGSWTSEGVYEWRRSKHEPD